MAGQAVSLYLARAVPIFLGLIVAYVTYVLIGPLSINYLLNPPEGRVRRGPAGLAIPIVWAILLFPLIVTWLRLLTVLYGDPGYVKIQDGKDPPQDFWTRDVFVCDILGRPLWCEACQTWKPDRAHHSRDAGRCILKMDHFCPWVGGVVAERSYNFFVQFLGWAMLLSAYDVAILGYFVHEDHSHPHWFVALSLGAFFCFFTIGMVINNLWLIANNATSIENLSRRSRRMFLAVALPPELQNISERPRTSDFTSEIDDPAHSRYGREGNWPMRRLAKSEYWKGTVSYPLTPPTDRPPLPAANPRVFAIIETPPGLNPWDLGSARRNFSSVFGANVHRWLFPFRHSPCCDHSSRVSFYPMGPQFEELLEQVGLVRREETRAPEQRPVLSEGWRNGERPDSWWIGKELRRMERYA
ncbi:zf-DHHC-domain-containing protein [Piedraia hortae CBS 480.64]|uniref:Palmitoyltransferase n=1 Tax=Piedraia hortae CBS 480.64 TaxID=1314780 RepID=A0A6A7C4A6_9PEZI|nr:zf-DHHC-domain-containing protein [Piedraia hortae CBS 480.64]